MVLFALLIAGTRIPVASAYGGTTAGLTQGDALALVFGGVLIVGATIGLERAGRVSPAASLFGVRVGLSVVAIGTIPFDGLVPDPTYGASTMPFPRVVLPAHALRRAPRRDRELRRRVAPVADAPPLHVPRAPDGVLDRLSRPPSGTDEPPEPPRLRDRSRTPLLVGYVVRTDAWGVLRAVVRDRVARRFGIGVGVLVALFFPSMSGYLSFFPEEGIHERMVAVLPAIYRLVVRPTLEVVAPRVPFFFAISPGVLVVVGTLSTHIGLNAALVARHWRVGAGAGATGSTAGTGAILGTCTCGCCGPLVAELALVAAGPPLAAPIYWVFVGSASPLGSVFVVVSILLFTGSLVYAVESVRESERAVWAVPAD